MNCTKATAASVSPTRQGRPAGPDWIQPYLDRVRDSLTSAEADITPTLWAFVALERMGGAGDVELDIEKITYSLRETNGCYHLNGSVAETSYFVLNCARSDALSGHPDLQRFIHGAVRWLISRQRPAGLWPTEQPLYSGDPQPPAYYTALSCRALAAYLLRYRPRSLAQIAIPDWRFRRRLTKIALRTTLSGIGCLAVVAVGTLLIPGNLGRLVTITGVIGTLLGAIAFVWDVQGRLAHRRTR